MSLPVSISSGFISYIPESATTLTPEYTTVEEDEVINFIDTEEGNVQRRLNALYIENTGGAALYIQPLPSKHIICIPAYESRVYDLTITTGIKVIGQANQTLRWSGCFI
jgi:hypothetical protein